jgi:GAF domain-containing protein
VPLSWSPRDKGAKSLSQCIAIPRNEKERLEALAGLRMLDTPPEERFDRIIRLAARIFEVPISYISLVDARRQWFKARHGIALTQTPRAVSFCSHAILRDEPLIVPDLAADFRFANSPLVTDEPRARFYAGVPLAIGDARVGTLCILDTKPRALSDREVQILRDLAALAESELQRPPEPPAASPGG